MKKDKLTILADIQTEFENSTMREINLAILVLKASKFLSSPISGFLVATISVILGVSIGLFLGTSFKNAIHPISLIIYLLFHLAIFKMYNRKSEKDLQEDEELKFSLECMLEIKRIKLETK